MKLPAIRTCRPAGAALALACVTLMLCAPAHAAKVKRPDRPRPVAVEAAKPVPPPAAAPSAAAGMLIAKDPETGALVPPTAEQVQRLTAAERTGLLRTSEGLTEVRFPDGSVMVHLQGRFMEFSVAQRDPAGCPRFDCVHDLASLLAVLAGSPPAPVPVLEER